MKTYLLSSALFSLILTPLLAQERLVDAKHSSYYEWFNQHSKTTHIFQEGATLYTFDEQTLVYRRPSSDASIITKLQIGQRVRNSSRLDAPLPENTWNGYTDIWLKVKGKDAQGKAFTGFVKGAQLAKTWSFIDVNKDGKKELIMLGISSLKRQKITDIKAELRVVQHKKLRYQKIVPGLCVFEECNSMALVRQVPHEHRIILEASTITLGCWTAIEKTYFLWNGNSLDLIYHAEKTTQKVHTKESFAYTTNEKGLNICCYSGEDQNFNPKWACKSINNKGKKKRIPAITAR